MVVITAILHFSSEIHDIKQVVVITFATLFSYTNLADAPSSCHCPYNIYFAKYLSFNIVLNSLTRYERTISLRYIKRIRGKFSADGNLKIAFLIARNKCTGSEIK